MKLKKEDVPRFIVVTFVLTLLVYDFELNIRRLSSERDKFIKPWQITLISFYILNDILIFILEIRQFIHYFHQCCRRWFDDRINLIDDYQQYKIIIIVGSILLITRLVFQIIILILHINEDDIRVYKLLNERSNINGFSLDRLQYQWIQFIQEFKLFVKCDELMWMNQLYERVFLMPQYDNYELNPLQSMLYILPRIVPLRKMFELSSCNLMNYLMIMKYMFSFENRKLGSQKPLILKSFTIWNQSTMFSLSPIKATYQEKNNYLALHRPGSLLMEWVPIKEPNHLQWDQKKQFNLGVKQIGQLLQFKYQSIKDTNINSPQFKRRFQLQKIEEDLNLTIYQDDEESKDKNPYSVRVTMPEFYTILELSSFALPFLVGWQALYNPQYVDVADE